jgi:hypothetical protein
MPEAPIGMSNLGRAYSAFTMRSIALPHGAIPLYPSFDSKTLRWNQTGGDSERASKVLRCAMSVGISNSDLVGRFSVSWLLGLDGAGFGPLAQLFDHASDQARPEHRDGRALRSEDLA